MFLPRPLLNDEDEDESHAPSRQSTSSSPCIALRPGLVHRLYSHQLHVRAKAKLQRDRLLSGPMIDIYVGKAKRHWSLHRNLLCHHSELLEAELEGDGEGNKRKETLELLEYDPAGFELLVKWLYQGKLDDVSDLADANQKYEYAVSCHKLYLLCDRLDMPQLKNVAMDQYRKGLNEAELVPDADEIDDIYRQSPQGSPFRQLMTRIAARQIMDPGSERDVETYRQCFDNNPDFAIDLVKAIKHGTGGMLFEDPTDPGNPCQYHDHEDGPNCHIKGKGKVKQARKTPMNHRDQPSSKSPPSTNSDLQNPPPLQHPPKTPRQSLPRQARPQDGTSVGPLRRRLTSPAISTVGTSQEMATASPPPNQDASKDREKWRKVTPPERKKRPQEQKIPEATETRSQHPAHEEPLQNSESASRQRPEEEPALDGSENSKSVTQDKPQSPPSRRGIWEWARAGTGRLNIMGRIPHPEWKGPLVKTEDATADGGEGTQDDFSVPSATATTPHNPTQQSEVTAAKLEGLGISQANFASPSFSQTKRSSDELVAAASSTGTPESKASRNDHAQWTNGVESTPSIASRDSPPSTPDTPTPQQRNIMSSKHEEPKVDGDGPQNDQDAAKGTTVKPEGQHEVSSNAEDASETDSASRNKTKSNMSAKKVNGHTSNPNRIPKYKIALAPNVLRTGTPNST